LIEGIPAHGDVCVVGEVEEERSLAITRCGTDEDQLVIYVLMDEIDKPGSM